MLAQDALLHLMFFLFAGAKLQKQVEDQTARILSMEEQENTSQPAAVAAAHGKHQPFALPYGVWWVQLLNLCSAIKSVCSNTACDGICSLSLA